MNFSIQPILENENTVLYPLKEEDFEALYAVAQDQKIWEQHPEKNRWKKEDFRTFFDKAITSKGAFKIINKASGKVIGSTRLYDYDAQNNSIMIGYTFYCRHYWGNGTNYSVKKMMLDYLFQYVSKVNFQAGEGNIRSQIAIGRLGAIKIGELVICFGESSQIKYLYVLTKDNWLSKEQTQ